MREQLATPGSSTQPPHTLVIGGGLAGISAALWLGRHGKPVTLVESKRRLGGRAGSFAVSNPEKSDEEQVVDYCQHVGMGCCTSLKQLISWLDQEEHWDEHSQLHFYGPTGNYQRLSALPLLPAPLHLASWLVRWPGLSWRDRISVARGLLKIGGLRINGELDQLVALDWLREHGQSSRAIQHFWSTIVVSALGEETSKVSMAAVCKVLQDGFMKNRSSFHLLVPNRSLNFLFNEGAALQLRQLGVQVLCSQKVESVSSEHDRFRVRFNNDMHLMCDAVVLAVPWHQLPHIQLPSPDICSTNGAPIAPKLNASPITGIHTWWDRAWLPTPHAAIVGRLCQWVFEKPSNAASEAARDDSERHYYQIVVSASHNLTARDAGDLGQRIEEDLHQVFPLSRDARLLKYKAVTDPQAVFSITPGLNAERPETQTSVRGLYLAGDWTNTGWPATMEGAIRSGFAAAEAASELDKHPSWEGWPRTEQRGDNRP